MRLPHRLAIRPRLRIGESPLSLFTRLAAVGRQSKLRRFARTYGMDVGPIAVGTFNETLSVLTGLDRAILEDWFPIPDGNEVVVHGTRLAMPMEWSSGVSTGRGRRHCPQCFHDDLAEGDGPPEQRAYARSWWNIAYLNVCLRHRSFLTTRCPDPSCGAELDQLSWPIHVCGACGSAVARGEGDPVGEDGCGADRYLQGRIGIVPPARMAILDDLPAGVAANVVFVVGTILADETEKNLARRDRSPDQVALVSTRGLQVFEDWPSRFHSVLDELSRRDRGRKHGARSTYGRLYDWMEENFPGPTPPTGIQGMRDVMVRHAKADLPFVKGLRMFGCDMDDSRYVFMKDAARGSGRTLETVPRIAAQLGLLSESDASLNRFERNRVDMMRQMLARILTLKQVVARLGVSYAVVADVLEAGSVRVVCDMDLEKLYLVDDIDQFADRCVAGLPTLERAPAGCSVGTAIGAPTATVVSGILFGVLHPLGVLEGRPGIPGLILSKQEVSDWLLRDRERIEYIKDVAVRLKTDSHVVRRLAKEGAFSLVPTGYARRVGVSATQLEAFLATYCTTRECIASSSAIRKARIGACLSAVGVFPSFLTGLKTPYFERTKLIAALPEAERVAQETIKAKARKIYAAKQAALSVESEA